MNKIQKVSKKVIKITSVCNFLSSNLKGWFHSYLLIPRQVRVQRRDWVSSAAVSLGDAQSVRHMEVTLDVMVNDRLACV